MVGPAVTVRCPACGTPLRAILAPSPPTQWLPCSNCHAPVPVVVPRDPPPLYTWEVQPGLYPALPAPKIPRWRARRVAVGALLGLSVVALALAGLFAYYAVAAPAPGQFEANGVVDLQSPSGSVVAGVGVDVTATSETGATFSTLTGADGSFSLSGLPTGGLTLNFSHSGYSPVLVDVFVSTLYSVGATGLSVQLAPGSAGNASTFALTPFSDVEQFVAAIGAGVLVLGLVAGVAIYAAALSVRSDRPALGVVGGGAGLLAPVALLDLSLGGPFPLLLAGSAAVAVLGATVVGLRAMQLLQTGPAAV